MRLDISGTYVLASNPPLTTLRLLVRRTVSLPVAMAPNAD